MKAKLFLATVLSLVLSLTALANVAKEEIKIGAILPLTGDWQTVGVQMKEGMLMRMKQQESRDSLFSYKLILEDSAGQPARKNSAYLKLVNVDKCQVVFDDAGLQIAKLAARDGKLFMNLSWDDKAAADAKSFIHCTPSAPQAQKIAEIFKALGVSRVAVFCEMHEGFMAMERAFLAISNELGLSVRCERFTPAERDFRGLVLKFHDFNPQAYLLLTGEPGFQILIRRIKERADHPMISAVEGFTYLADLTPYNGYFYVAGNQPTDSFVKRFQEIYPGHSVGFAGNTYDMVDLTIYAYETAGKRLGRLPTTAEAAAELYYIKDYPGAIGPLTMGENRVIQSSAVLKYIENGKAVTITLEELKLKLGK